MKVLVAGGTGLIGSFLLKALDADPRIDSVIALTRRDQQNFGKITWQKVDLGDIDQIGAAAKGCQAAVSCLGTTMKIAGSKPAFEKVDYEYVVNLASASKAEGIALFRAVSAIGASSNSGVYYSRIKGKTEEAVTALGFSNLLFFRPSLLLGPRKEYRFGERVGAVFMKLFSPLMLGSLRKNKPIQAETVANAIGNSLFLKLDIAAVYYDEMV